MLTDFLEAISTRQVIAGRQIFIGSSTPVNPANSDIWIDPGNIYSNLWVFSSALGLWLSEMKCLSASFDGIWSTSSPATLRAIISIGDDENSIPFNILVRRFTLGYMMGATSHSSTNRYNFAAFFRNSVSGVSNFLSVGSTQITHSTATSVSNRSYHKTWFPDILIGSLGCIQTDSTRNGSPGGLSGVSTTAYFQYTR
jgi:hypothetical protein